MTNTINYDILYMGGGELSKIKVIDADSCEVFICICSSCNIKFGICTGDLDILEHCPNCGIRVDFIDDDE